MTFIIFLFVISVVTFSPTVTAEDNYTLQLMFEDLSGEIIYNLNNLSGNFINENGTALNFTINNYYEPDCTINRTFISDNPIPLGNYNSTIYQSRLFKDAPENLLPIITTIAESEIRFQDETKIYPISLDELDGKPSKFVMYDMANKSYNLATQSKETADLSLFLTFVSLGFAVTSLVFAATSLTIAFKTIRTANRRQQFKYHYNGPKGSTQIQYGIFILLTLVIVAAAVIRSNTEGYDLWTLDTVIEVLLGFLILSFTIDK